MHVTAASGCMMSFSPASGSPATVTSFTAGQPPIWAQTLTTVTVSPAVQLGWGGGTVVGAGTGVGAAGVEGMGLPAGGAGLLLPGGAAGVLASGAAAVVLVPGCWRSAASTGCCGTAGDGVAAGEAAAPDALLGAGDCWALGAAAIAAGRPGRA